MNIKLKNTIRLYSSLFLFIKTKLIIIEIFLIYILSFILLLLSFKINYEEINNVLHSLITVTGIFSGIIISVLSIKIFQLKEKKEILYKDFCDLSIKLMFFRRICYQIKSSKIFWKTFDDISWFENNFKGISFNEIHSPSGSKDRSSNFWLSSKLEISKPKADLYLTFKQILNDPNDTPYWVIDKKIVHKNTIEYLNNVLMPSNQIWYYLDSKYEKDIKGEISFELNQYEINQLQQYISELDPLFKNKEIDRKLIAEIGSKFYENYIPRLIDVTKALEITFPNSIIGLFVSMLLLILTGVITPMIILFFLFNLKTLLISTSILIFLYTFEIIYFFNIFFDFIRSELKYI